MNLLTPRHLLWWLMSLVFATPALSAIQISTTRVIFNAASSETSVQVRNQAKEAILIQSWIEPATATTATVPFAITPSLTRIGGNKQQLLRIFYQGEGLPQDKESVFWLNIQEIPQASEESNSLQVAFRQRLKLFYRPTSLKTSPEDALKSLSWRLQKSAGKTALLAVNNTPFYVSLLTVKLRNGNKEYSPTAEMLSPFSQTALPLNNADRAEKGRVEWSAVNDYGAVIKHSAEVHF
ncbi:molecular chaperone [Enterobacter hormaechei]